MWPECLVAYHSYIREKKSKMYKVEIIAPTVEIIPNIPTESHKRLTLKRLYEEEEITIYKIGDNYIKKCL